MSRSPRTTFKQDSLAEYRTAWQATTKLLREGNSFSGRERNCAFLNAQGQQFANVSSITGLDFDDDGRGLGITDWDQDGDLDIWFHNRTGPRLRFMRNQTISSERKSEQHFVAFRLQGTVSNRDAIGAQVSVFVEGNSKPLIRTLYAGDAFLSQSTKWLHFGIGKAQQIDRVVVRWPNGTTEQFLSVKIDTRYRIVEGSGRCTALPSRSSNLAVKSSPQPVFVPSGQTRAYFSNRLPLPILNYSTLENPTKVQTVSAIDQPSLIVLWASWCPNCVRELESLTNRAERIRELGLNVLALSLDGLDENHTTEPSDAKVLVERIGFPFDVGLISRESLSKLERLQDLQFNRMQPIAIPSSILVSRNGEMATSYRGELDWKTFEEDLRGLDASALVRRQKAVPFSGRWSSPPKQILLRAIAQNFQKYGYKDDYSRYLKLEAESLQRQRELSKTNAERQAFDLQFASANFNLGMSLVASGQASEAIEYFKQAVDAQPNHVDALTNLGVLLARRRQVESAIGLFERALKVDPHADKARINLAAALGASKRFDDAIKHYRFIVEKSPSNFTAQSRLARFLLETGQAAAAVPHLQNAVRLQKNDFASSISLAWLLATHPDNSIRNANNALELSNHLKESKVGNQAIVLDVLAAAQAENMEFDRAIETVQNAMKLLPSNHNLRAVMESRLNNYKTNQPFRDADGKYP